MLNEVITSRKRFFFVKKIVIMESISLKPPSAGHLAKKVSMCRDV